MNKGIQKIFSEVPKTYQLINGILTFGMDNILRKRAAKMAVECGGTMWLDVCTGTGDMARTLTRYAAIAKVFGVDFSAPMLKEAVKKSSGENVVFSLGDVSSLPFKDGSFDVVIISFAARNINYTKSHLLSSIGEFYRILKPSGVFINLETSQPSFKIIRVLFHFYVKLVVRRVGCFISGSDAAYSYLSHTIPHFYNPDEFAKIIQDTGFSSTTYKRGMLGTAAIHKAIKK